MLICAECATNRLFAQLFAVTGLAGKISKKQTEPGAVAPELPLRAL